MRHSTSRRTRSTKLLMVLLVVVVIIIVSLASKRWGAANINGFARAPGGGYTTEPVIIHGQGQQPKKKADDVPFPGAALLKTKLGKNSAESNRIKAKQKQVAQYKSDALALAPEDEKLKKLQMQEWELNYLRNILQRKDRILDETHDEMLNAMDDLRSALRSIGSPPPGVGEVKRLPCHCLEQSAMAPENIWCDNRRSRISGAHVCVLANVCFGGGEKLIFLSPQISNNERSSVGVRIAGTDQSGTIVFTPPASRGAASSIFAKIQNTTVQRKTLVLYASKFPNHITHVLEGAGGLHFSIHRNRLHAEKESASTGTNGTTFCAPHDLTCFPTTIGAMHFHGSSSSGGWHENVLRIMMEDHKKEVAITYQEHIAELPFQCYEKAIVPGFYYSVFPDTEDTSSFQASSVQYLEASTSKAGEPWTFSRGSRLGKILMSKRTSKRSVRDWDTLVRFVEEVAANFTTAEGKSITVDQIEYGGTSFEHQASKTADADVLMGLHGADLTNMMFLRRGSVILEMNPLFFFENRFYELANNLGLHYMVWTCTTEHCAFGGGQAERFRAVVAPFGYDFPTRTFHKGGQVLRWPYDRYLGYSCPQCDALGVQISEFRDTDVFVGKSLDEIKELLERAFTNLQWRRK